MTRSQLLETICNLVGRGISIVEASDGWPGIVDVELPDGKSTRVALHVSNVSSHARADYEYRFQNPGNRSPVSGTAGLPILLGLGAVEGRPILVAADGRSRVDRVARFSILFNVNAMQKALSVGWYPYQSNTGERIYAFLPTLLPVYVELLGRGFDLDFLDSTNSSIQVAISASGIIDDLTFAASERARRAASILIRDYAFGSSVVQAYGGFCAMCGLNAGLVVGAHIMPVKAANSPDKIWNGLALCHNHHAVFDQHKVWVNPVSRVIAHHPDILKQSRSQPALRVFVENAHPELTSPVANHNRPKREMFEARYEYFNGAYDWASRVSSIKNHGG